MCLLGETEKGLQVAVVNGIGLIAFLEPVSGEFANRLEHQKARLFEIGNAAEQALIGELVERVDHVEAAEVSGRPAHRLQLGQAATPREYREPRQQATLAGVQQVVTPLNCAAKRLLTAGKIASSGSERGAQGLIQPAEQGLRRKELDPGGRQFDRERQPVDALTDSGDGGRIVIGGLEIRLDRDRALDEEPDCLELRKGREVRQGLEIGQRQRGHRKFLFAVDAQDGAAADQHPQARAALQQRGRDRRSGQQLLEVVEDEQGSAIAQVFEQPLDRPPAAGALHR